MRDRIYLVPPPTSLDAHSIARSNYHAPSCPCSHRISTPSTPGLRQEPPIASTRRHLAVQTVFGGSGISTRCPSPTAFALGLGPTNPERTSLAQETLAIRCVRFPLTFRYSCRHSHFRTLQQSLRSAFTASGTLPYQSSASKLGDDFATSVQRLSPVKFSARDHLTSELLRTLSMMAASEPTSWLFMQSHIVHHLALI